MHDIEDKTHDIKNKIQCSCKDLPHYKKGKKYNLAYIYYNI